MHIYRKRLSNLLLAGFISLLYMPLALATPLSNSTYKQHSHKKKFIHFSEQKNIDKKTHRHFRLKSRHKSEKIVKQYTILRGNPSMARTMNRHRNAPNQLNHHRKSNRYIGNFGHTFMPSNQASMNQIINMHMKAKSAPSTTLHNHSNQAVIKLNNQTKLWTHHQYGRNTYHAHRHTIRPSLKGTIITASQSRSIRNGNRSPSNGANVPEPSNALLIMGGIITMYACRKQILKLKNIKASA